MHISQLTFKGIRGYSQEVTLQLSPTTNYFVGENNSGKSSILDAICYLRNDTRTPDETFTIGLDKSYVEATLAFANDEAEHTLATDYKKLESYFTQSGPWNLIDIRRQSYEDTVTNSKTNKPSKITTKNILVRNPNNAEWENPTGIAALVQRLFDTCFIYADEQVANHADMAKTKTLGKLISEQLTSIEEGTPWQQYMASHAALFESTGAGTVQEQLQTTAERVSTLMSEQYGDTSITFAFTPPETQALLKSGHVFISEPQETIAEMPLENKGTGMQRAFMLALLQVVAETSDNTHSGTVYGLDEPETWLHPRAQAQLSHALSKLSANGRQILIFSHSPYMLKNIDVDNDLVYIVERKRGAHTITLEKNFRTQPQQYITLNAINYYAFQLATPEFLDELYGHFQELVAGPTSSLKEKQICSELEQCNVPATRAWYNNNNPNTPYMRQVAIYVRNSIHHPENSLNAPYTYSDLEQGISELLSAIERKKKL
jgi:hypothetical protein